MTNTTTEIIALPAFTDNYIWLLRQGKFCAVVDPGQADVVIDYTKKHKLTLTHILVTHHHYDHIDGIPELLNNYRDVVVTGIKSNRVGVINHYVEEGDTFTLNQLPVKFVVMGVPGHTIDHIAFYNSQWLFCGDTLFSGGCGRLFEGTPVQMHDSLQRLANLDENTSVYCTHEYTMANLEFAVTVDSANPALLNYREQVIGWRKNGQISLPSTIALEKQINPFLRTDQASIVERVAELSAAAKLTETATFAQLRRLKDQF